MSQITNLQHQSNSDSVPLFACTKCNSRHPFEELSQSHQLCKDCRSTIHVIKCNYCRSEFHQETKSNSNGSKSSSICKKCEQLEEQHGKPGPCAYCNIIAAFIGTKCQRCTNSEKKYGPPLSCEHCKQKCAFDREDSDGKKKVDGKLLCWLCTMAYKRTLTKAKQKEMAKQIKAHHRSGGNSSNIDSKLSSNRHRHHHSTTSSGQRHSSNTNSIQGSSDSYQRSSLSSNSRHQSNQSMNGNGSLTSKHRDNSSSKKQRLDISTSGLQSVSTPTISSLMDGRFLDPNSVNDLSSVVTQLKEQVATLNKRLQMKEKDLLLKDQQIAELQATITRTQRESREKVNALQKQHSERLSELQARLMSMQRQLVSQAKAARASPTYVEPPLVI